MSEDSGRDGKGKPRGKAADRQSADYEVGYGKPPRHTRFVKGQSGNPRGRPRKSKPPALRLSDAPSDGFVQEEAYRLVALRENGQRIQLPALQAVARSMFTEAIKGKRLSQKYLLEHLADLEKQYRQLEAARYARLEALKRDGEQKLTEHERKELPPPDLVPHPDDIVINPATFDAYVDGPETPEDVPRYEHTASLRDHLLLRAAHADEARNRSKVRHETGSHCAFMVFAQYLDQTLPRRYRWKEDEAFDLYVSYTGLTRRERERRIDAETTRLKATKPRPTLITPEMEQGIDRIGRELFGKRGRHLG